ncbi:NAD(P)-binding protein [Rhodofomes roseus]|uniref:NAD(P)-binding protein n=1 Tax=Rhodofomes roseus TaxID=34475 RepID=A0A4Y9YMX9_9APHY|nr:NAD(P)-binding protein [Rhodofomes roseus]KAH9831588.1 NAD(P)-binding protein [Rhodofomes roseus]TFY62987.1 hypothetical protein EVJ58_g3510 [Rhodofomes roseus]
MSSPTAASTTKKLILVIGATGGQGMAVIDKLLAPGADGSPSPYAIRALTRNPDSRRAKELAARGIELKKGSTHDLASVAAALQGAYGAFVNTDSFTIGQEAETWAGIRIFELAKQAGVKHYVWSNLEYIGGMTDYDPKYQADHYNGKGRVHEFMKSQPSVVSDTDMSWSVITSGPYMDMLHNMVFGPMKKRDDGTIVFATPIGEGSVPMIALSDFGFFARYTFDNRKLTSTADLKIGSDWVDWEYLRTTFEKVTGQKAEVVYQSSDDWCDNFVGVDRPLAADRTPGDGSTTWRQNWTRWWALYRDELIKRDWEWIRKVNPNGHNLESWMRAENYGSELWKKLGLLKQSEDGQSLRLNTDRIAQL